MTDLGAHVPKYNSSVELKAMCFNLFEVPNDAAQSVSESKSLSPFLLSLEAEVRPRPGSQFLLLLLKYLSITITAATGTLH